MTEHLPVPTEQQPLAVAQPDVQPERQGGGRRQPISVAFLPLALVAFVVVSFVAAAWTLLATAGV
jgi:hypothetical protein